MARKRKSKRIDEFLRSRQQGQEVVLRESIRQANLLFRIVVTVLLVALLLLLLNIGEKDEFQREQIGVAGLLTMVTVLGVLVINRIQPALFQSTAKFNQFVLLIVLTVSLSWGMFALSWPAYLLPLPALAMIAGLAYSSMGPCLLPRSPGSGSLRALPIGCYVESRSCRISPRSQEHAQAVSAGSHRNQGGICSGADRYLLQGDGGFFRQ